MTTIQCTININMNIKRITIMNQKVYLWTSTIFVEVKILAHVVLPLVQYSKSLYLKPFYT